MNVLVVKDEEGELRPQAGCWKDNDNGRYGADVYLKKNPEITIVGCELKEVETF
jgi:hypothetical protein